METWSPAKRVAFRYAVVLGAIYAFPFPLGYLPKTDWISEILNKPFEWLTIAVARLVGLGTPPTEQTGSGDTLFAWVWFATLLVLAGIGAAIWTAVDRKRLAYPRLLAASHVGLRYLLAATMLGYGFAKVVPTQFPSPFAWTLDERVGEMSPMGMLWTFMGSSAPYTIFAGLAEVLGGTLLFWRRTATLGALVSAGVLANVVMLNLCYDVPVKLYSSQLLVIALVIAAPQLRRVVAVILGRAAPAAPERVRGTPRFERVRLIVKTLVIVALLGGVALQVHDSIGYAFRTLGPLDGSWQVTEADAATPAGERWARFALESDTAMVRFADDTRAMYGATIDDTAHTIVLESDQSQTYTYRWLDPFAIRIDALHMTLRRAPAWLLETRGFHWVQEYPFNR